MVRMPGFMPNVAPEYLPERLPGARPHVPDEYEQRQPSAIPPAERGDPDLEPPPRMVPEPEPAGV